MRSSATSTWQAILDGGVRELALAMSDGESIAMAEQFGAHNYHPLPINLVRGEGCLAYDGEGKEYIDCVGAYSAVAHGHLSPGVVRAAIDQLQKLTLTSRAVYTTETALFCRMLAEFCDLDVVCPMNTGAEAVETCIKVARKWGYERKAVPRDSAEIIVCEGNFHGRTTTIVGFSSEPSYRDGFGPFAPGFKVVPFGDAGALEAAITPNTVAFLAEPIQAEGGVIVPPTGYMAEVRRICDHHRVLLIWDEVQTGFCRTGRRFGWQHEDARPDLMAVGKALGGGLLPVSAAVGRREAMDVLRPGTHGSTFGGCPLSCAVALAAMAEMVVEDYAQRAEERGSQLRAGIRAIGDPRIIDVRGRGLLVGVEFDESTDTDSLQSAFLAEGLLTKETRHRTFRFAPPIVISAEQVDEVVGRLQRALRSRS